MYFQKLNLPKRLITEYVVDIYIYSTTRSIIELTLRNANYFSQETDQVVK